MLSKEVRADYEQAGKIIQEALAYGQTLIKPGENILNTLQAIEEKIRSLGGEIAFPAQVSIDHIAAHWCPEPDSEETYKEGQLVKLDIGCHINGRIADTAVSIDLSTDDKHAKLIKAAEDARDNALAMMKPGVTLGEIGRVIQETITKAGYSPVRNLSGHGLGEYDVHTTPSIPNIDTGDDTELEAGMVVAVEPFATTGKGVIFEQDYGNIYSLHGKIRVRGVYARKALKIIQGYNGLPFTLHWLAQEMGTGQAKLAMRELAQHDNLEIYPPLPDQAGGIVSQAEHSCIITEDGCHVYTRD